MPRWDAHVDESGSRLDASGGQGRFVLVCMAGSPAAISGLVEKIRRLKLELVPGADPANWELYAGDMFHARRLSPRLPDHGRKNVHHAQDCGHRVRRRHCAVWNLYHAAGGGQTRRHGCQDCRARHSDSRRAPGVACRGTWGRGDAARGIGQRKGKATPGNVKGAGTARGRTGAAPRNSARRDGNRVCGLAIQAADAIAYIINRHVGGDAAFGGMFGDIRQKARADGSRGGLRIESGRRAG